MKRSLPWVFASVLALAAGCRFLVSVRDGTIWVSGVVEDRAGAPVWKARVWVDSTATTFTDPLGRFTLRVPARGKPFFVTARDGYTPGRAYAETCGGASEVPPHESHVSVRIVLNGCSPI